MAAPCARLDLVREPVRPSSSGRPLNEIVSCHCTPMSKLGAAVDLELTSQALGVARASAVGRPANESASQLERHRGPQAHVASYVKRRVPVGGSLEVPVEAPGAMTANNAFERTVRHRGALVPRSVLIAWLRQDAPRPAAQLGR